jgi:transposase
MFGPGEYRPDPTEGIPLVEDLPPPKIIVRRRNAIRHLCPHCGHHAYRDKQKQRTLHDLGDLRTGRPRDLQVTYAQYYCTPCRRYFTTDLLDLAPLGSQYTHRVVHLAVRLVVEDGLPYRPASWHLWRDHRVFVPFATIQNWVEAGGKKSRGAYGHGLP